MRPRPRRRHGVPRPRRPGSATRSLALTRSCRVLSDDHCTDGLRRATRRGRAGAEAAAHRRRDGRDRAALPGPPRLGHRRVRRRRVRCRHRGAGQPHGWRCWARRRTRRAACSACAATRRPGSNRTTAGRRRTVRELVERLQSDRYRVRPNQVYLADGVARHFGLVGVEEASGTPGFVAPTSLVSSVRPAVEPPWVRPRLDLPGRARPERPRARHRAAHPRSPAPSTRLLDNCVIHEPWLTERTVGRRGRARRRRPRPARLSRPGTARSSAASSGSSARTPRSTTAGCCRASATATTCPSIAAGIERASARRRRRGRHRGDVASAPTAPDDAPSPTATIAALLGAQPRRRLGRQRRHHPAVLPGGPARRRRRRRPRPAAAGRRSPTSGRGSTPARPASTSSARSSRDFDDVDRSGRPRQRVPRLGDVERHELRRAEGGRRRRPGDVPQRRHGARGVEPAAQLPPYRHPDLGQVFNV